MKAKIMKSETKKEFEPFELTITADTIEEASALYFLIHGSVGELIKTEIESQGFEIQSQGFYTKV